MRVLLHDALSGVFHRSGIGQALRQQKEALDRFQPVTASAVWYVVE